MPVRISPQRPFSLVLLVGVLIACASADGKAQSTEAANPLKQLPPAGIEIPAQSRSALVQRVAAARKTLDRAIADSSDPAAWSSDVEVLIRAVDLALNQNLFFKQGQVGDADRLLAEAERRIEAAVGGARGLKLMGFDPSKNQNPQPLVGGFVSRIDGSVQPFGIVVPAGYTLDQIDVPHRLDVWLHGRGDTKTEIPFLVERMTKVGQYTPKNTLVLHPFGRHCNAFKFAGETDVYESMDHVESICAVDTKRISIRGFSMGGAGCWHLAAHDPTRWMAANPGAGFVDTIEYQGWTESTPFQITPTAEKLLRWYDILPWTQNLEATHTIAYSGEVDKQRMAADRVAAKAKQLGFEFPYVIGEAMGHKINDVSKQKIDSQIDRWSEEVDSGPRREIDFKTYTLRYSRADWIRITGMEEHWTMARVKATLDPDKESIGITTQGVTHLEIDFSDSGWPGRRGGVQLVIDDQSYSVEDTGNLRGFQFRLAKDSQGQWTEHARGSDELRKSPGMQGPIDDAFCDRFLIVLPSRPAKHGRVQRWIDRETAYLKRRWSRLMRGDVQVVMDREVTADQIENCNLICFGDLSSNRLLFNIADQIPIRWTRETLQVGDRNFDPANHVPVFCYPNPMNPKRYLVVNSGMTFRDFSNTSNSRQIAMLPDWAVLEVTKTDDSIYAGKIADQGFFDESWQLPGADQRRSALEQKH